MNPDLSRRRLTFGTLLAIPAVLSRSALSAPAVSPSPGPAPGPRPGNAAPKVAPAIRTVTIAGPPGWFQAAFDSQILGPFRKLYPDIAIFYYPTGNAFQTLALLRSQRQYPSTDVVLLEAGVAARAATDGLLEPLSPDTMPVIKDLVPQAIMPDLLGPGLVLDSLALGYNPGLIAQPPRFWRNLWDPAYGSRIALTTPPDPLGLAMTVVAAKIFGGRDQAVSLDIGLTTLTRLIPRVAIWNPVPDVYTAIALGDAAIGPVWNARAQNQAAQTPGRFAALIPDEGSPYLMTTVNLVKGAPQPDAARTLIAWLLGPDAQRLLAETMFLGPVNATALVAKTTLSQVGATEAMAARRIEMDWVGVTKVRDQITASWRARGLATR